MYLQGGKLEGAIYGSISPADYSGLAGWWRATDGVSFNAGNRVSQWNDISGNNRHLTAVNLTNTNTYAPISFYGNLVQTNNGVGITGGDGNGGLGVMSDYTFKPILYDGRKMSVTTIYKLLGAGGGGFAMLVTSKTEYQGTGAGLYNCGIPLTTTQSVRTINSALTQIAVSDITNAYSTVYPQGHVLSMIDYGYDAASPNLHRKAVLDNVVRTERKFSAAPSSGYTNTPMYVQFGGGVPIFVNYEFFIFDHTGKTTQQIDFEQQSLYTNYIIPRYPNLFL